MKPSLSVGGLAVVGMMLLAGCTGNFDVQQTEPFRVRLEGDPQTVVVRDGDAAAQEVVIATCDDPCDHADEDQEINVKVNVKQVSSGACAVLVTIKNKATGAVIEQREVRVGGTSSGTTTTGDSGNATGNGTTTVTTTETQTQTADGTDVVVQNFFVTVKGRDNIVVLTQAIEGDANVDISAVKASGNADASIGDDDATTSTTMTTSASGNTTASGNATSSGP